MTTRYRSFSSDHTYHVRLQMPSGVNKEGTATVSKTSYMEDELTVGYFGLKRRGMPLPVNPMSRYGDHLFEMPSETTTKWKRVRKSDGVQLAKTDFIGHLAGSYFHKKVDNSMELTFPTSLEPAWPTDTGFMTTALANARASSFDILTFVAELHKTRDLIARAHARTLQRATRIQDDIIRTVKRSRGSSKKWKAEQGLSYLARFGEVWMEGRYGWRILAYELEAVTEALIKLQGTIESSVKRAYVSDSAVASYVAHSSSGEVLSHYPGGTWTSNNISRVSGSITQECEKTIRCGVGVNLLASNIAFVDPLVTAWEVLPFSFIVDWFVNVGESVKAFSPFANGNLKWAFRSARKRVTTITSVTPVVPTGGSSTVDALLEGFVGTSEMRHVYSDYDRLIEDPTFSLAVDINVDLAKLVDLASIALAFRFKLMDTLLKLTRV